MEATSKQRILIIDDDRAVCASISLLLKKNNYEVQSIHHPTLAMETIEEFKPQLLILDLNFTIETSGRQGLHLLKQILSRHPHMLVILMTGWATVQLAVEGMKLGAKDFLAKPWDNKSLLNSIHSILHIYGSTDVQKSFSSSDISLRNQMIGSSEEFLEVLDMAERVASTEASVLILGESGTGKELLAEYIHQLSKRQAKGFVKVNLGGISTSIFESEMFGHTKGAFTDAHSDRKGRFEVAHEGTIFLDEIGELTMDNQVKLLRVLQEKTFEKLGSSQAIHSDFRVISATNKDLLDMVYTHRFREDLYYRINLITLRLPSLSERSDDIPALVMHFAHQIATLYGKELPYISKETLDWLSQLEYPGNVRELKNRVERTLLLHFDQKEINRQDFLTLQHKKEQASNYSLPQVGSVSLDEMEEKMVRQALAFHQHNISHTAKSLGLSRSALYRRLEKYNIPYEP